MEWKDVLAWVSAVAAIVSACGLLLTFWQVRLVKQLATTQFEDGLGREYRDLAVRLPSKALLGEELSEEEHAAALDEFIHYIDLCNEQVFLRRCNRISPATWEYWRDGIRTNLEQPAFARAWQEVKKRSANFRELRRLERDRFKATLLVGAKTRNQKTKWVGSRIEAKQARTSGFSRPATRQRQAGGKRQKGTSEERGKRDRSRTGKAALT